MKFKHPTQEGYTIRTTEEAKQRNTDQKGDAQQKKKMREKRNHKYPKQDKQIGK